MLEVEEEAVVWMEDGSMVMLIPADIYVEGTECER
jgi:hypothetical protein